MDLGLEEKVRASVLLIRHAYRHAVHRNSRLEVAYSGGKDSDVLLELCRMADLFGKSGLRPLHRCTTIDPVGTLRHCRENGVEILRPSKSFRRCIVDSGFPSRFYRHCCGELKEFAVEDYVVVGVRRCESVQRMKSYKEPEQCRIYNGRGKCIQYYPLLEWSDEDVRQFVEARGIKCHPLYYDEDGAFHVERRLGCVGCPLQTKKKRAAEFLEHPRFVRFWLRAGAEFMALHPKSQACAKFANVYEWFVGDLFCKDYADFVARFRAGLFPVDCRRYLEEYFSISLDF